MTKIFGAVLIVVLIIVALPMAVKKMGIGVKDMGIKITTQDSAAAREKVGTEIIAIKEGEGKADFTLEGKKEANFAMDSKELTALSNNRPWKNYPVKNLQIKINDDGTVESSGVLIVSKAIPYAISLGYSESQIRGVMEKYKVPQFEIPIFVKGKGSVINDRVTVEASEVKMAMIPIPAGIVSQANKEAEKLLEDIISKHSNSFHAQSLTFEQGEMKFVGQVPAKEYVLTE